MKSAIANDLFDRIKKIEQKLEELPLEIRPNAFSIPVAGKGRLSDILEDLETTTYKGRIRVEANACFIVKI